MIAAEESKFVEVFVRRGLVPDGGAAYLLPRIVGVQKTKELLFFGDDVRAADALAMGLVNRIVPRDELSAAAEEWAKRLAAGPTRSIALTKWLVNRSLESDRAGVSYVRGERFYADRAGSQELRLCFSSVAADRIDEGIRRLAAGVIAGRGRRAAAEGTRPLV